MGPLLVQLRTAVSVTEVIGYILKPGESFSTAQTAAREVVEAPIYDLWPVTLDHMELVPTLRELCSRQQSASGIRHSLRVFGMRERA